jgi:hypothetical protein
MRSDTSTGCAYADSATSRTSHRCHHLPARTDLLTTVTIDQADTDPPDPVALDTSRFIRILPDGRCLALDRRRGTATYYFGPPLTPDLLAHPYLGPVATTFNRWAGRETFHAGAFVLAGRAWAVLGPRTAGKSTLLAAMADRGEAVLSDDILVTDASSAYAGPRCIDLRRQIPGARTHARPVRKPVRLRISLPPIPISAPLRGWIFLHWGDALSLTPVPPPELLARLAARRSWKQLPSSPTTMLAIATLPAWDLVRPSDWSILDETHRMLTVTLCSADFSPAASTWSMPARGPSPASKTF